MGGGLQTWVFIFTASSLPTEPPVQAIPILFMWVLRLELRSSSLYSNHPWTGFYVVDSAPNLPSHILLWDVGPLGLCKPHFSWGPASRSTRYHWKASATMVMGLHCHSGTGSILGHWSQLTTFLSCITYLQKFIILQNPYGPLYSFNQVLLLNSFC